MIVIKKAFIYILFIFSIIFCISSVSADEDTVTYDSQIELYPEIMKNLYSSYNSVLNTRIMKTTQLTNGDYVVTGIIMGSAEIEGFTLTNSSITDDAVVLRYNSNNELIFAENYGNNGADAANFVVPTSDGGYIVGGHYSKTATFQSKTLTSKGSQDIYIARYNQNNEIVSLKSYGSTGVDSLDYISINENGEYIVASRFAKNITIEGSTFTNKGGNDILITKYDSNDQLVFSTSIAGSGTDTANGLEYLPDGGYLISGTFNQPITINGETYTTESGKTSSFIARYNKNNEIVNVLTSSAGFKQIKVTSDGGYLLTATYIGDLTIGDVELPTTSKSQSCVIKFDSNNNAEFGRTFFAEGGRSALISILDMDEDSFILAGSYTGTITVGDQEYTSNGSDDVMLVKMGFDNKIDYSVSFGGTGMDTVSSVLLLNNGGILTTGITQKPFKFFDKATEKMGSYLTILREVEFERDIDFTKVDKDTKEKLKNAKFKIKKADIDKYYIDPLTFGSLDKAKVFTSDEEGNFDALFKVKGLYYLEEIESPEGYRKNDYAYILEVKQDGIKVIKASSVLKNSYESNLPEEDFYNKTNNLLDNNKKDRYQKNYQEISKNGYTIKKQAEWTDINQGQAKITIKITRPPLIKEEEQLETRVVYAFTTCTAHGFSYELAKRNIEQLLANYNTVDIIIANGESINDLVIKKDVKDAEEVLKNITFKPNQHWGVNLYTGFHNYFKTTNPNIVYASFDLLTLTKDGDKYTDDSTWNKLKEYEQQNRYYSLVGDYRLDEHASNKLRWKTIAGLVSPNSWNGFDGEVDLYALEDIPFSYENDFRTLNIDIDPNSKNESVSKSIFTDILASNLSIKNVSINESAKYKILGNKVEVNLTDIDVYKEVIIEIDAELNEESADSNWFNTNKGDAILEETRRFGREYKPKYEIKVESPKLAELGFTYEGEEIESENGVYLIENEKSNKHDIKIKKIDGLTNDSLTNAEFTLSGKTDDGKEISIKKTTNANGLLTFEDIEEGDYILKETKAPVGYEKQEDGFKVKVKKDGVKIYGLLEDSGYFIVNNFQAEKMTIKKVDENGEVLKGATFKVTGHTDDGVKIEKEYATNEEGIIELEKGSYTVREIKAPNGYVLNSNSFFLDKDNTIVEVVNNKVKGTIKVTKKWSDIPDDGVVPEIRVQGIDKNGNLKYNNTTKNDESKWIKNGSTWEYLFEISDLGLKYTAWEEHMPAYVSSNTDENPLVIDINKENIITNTLIKKHTLELTKEVVGENDKEFEFNIKIYDRDNKLLEGTIKIIRNGKEEEISLTNKGIVLKLKDKDSIIFNLETGYKYEIKEKDTDYVEYHLIEGIKDKTKGNKVSGKLTSDIKVKFINEITNTLIKKHTLELTKEVVGENDKEFEFNIKIYDRDNKLLEGTIKITRNGKEEEISLTNKGIVLKLKDKDSIIFNLETGYKYEIKEKDTDYVEYHLIEGIKDKTKGNKVSGKLTSDIKVKFINEKEKNSKISSNGSEIPNTGDNINTYVWYLFISLIGFVLSIIYLIKNKREKLVNLKMKKN